MAREPDVAPFKTVFGSLALRIFLQTFFKVLQNSECLFKVTAGVVFGCLKDLQTWAKSVSNQTIFVLSNDTNIQLYGSHGSSFFKT